MAPPQRPARSGAWLSSDTHTYPVELDLPSWSVAAAINLRTWLFAFGTGSRIASPQALRDEHRQKLETAVAVYEQPEETHYNVMTARAEGHGTRSGAAAAGLSRAAPAD